MTFLYLCVANSARSQMAHGWGKALLPEHNHLSAGSGPSFVNPFAIQAMDEVGIDISHHTSNGVDEYEKTPIDIVITLCEQEVCPIFLGDAKKYHWPHKDPNGRSNEESLRNFRAVRDQIEEKMKVLKAAVETRNFELLNKIK